MKYYWKYSLQKLGESTWQGFDTKLEALNTAFQSHIGSINYWMESMQLSGLDKRKLMLIECNHEGLTAVKKAIKAEKERENQ